MEATKVTLRKDKLNLYSSLVKLLGDQQNITCMITGMPLIQDITKIELLYCWKFDIHPNVYIILVLCKMDDVLSCPIIN